MACFFCSAAGTRAAAIGVCIECGCAACGQHGGVETVSRSVRTGNMFQERSVEDRRFGCVACRSLRASRVPRGLAQANAEAFRSARSDRSTRSEAAPG